MARLSLRGNPFIAAVLGTVVTGLGHLYLRRWLRALGWVGVTIAVSALFVPEAALSALASGTLTNPLAVVPVVLISAASAFDAFRIAAGKRANSVEARERTDTETDGTETTVVCPACGKDVDPELGFCHWCSTEFEVVDDELTRHDEHTTNER